MSRETGLRQIVVDEWDTALEEQREVKSPDVVDVIMMGYPAEGAQRPVKMEEWT